MRHTNLRWSLPALALLLGNVQSQAQMQTSANVGANQVTVLAEPAAAGFQYERRTVSGVRFGVELLAGPQFAVDVANEVRDVRAWAGAHAVVAYRFKNRAELSLSPVGASAVVGNDFGTVYPSGQAGAGFAVGKVRLTTLLRVIRIAGGNGSGTYWTQWIPIRLGYSIGRS